MIEGRAVYCRPVGFAEAVRQAGDGWQYHGMKLDEKALTAEVRASQWLADGNAARERGNMAKAEKCYAKSQFWLDRYNKLTGRA